MRTKAAIAANVGVGESTVYRTKRRFVLGNLVVINLKTAKALGLEIPDGLVASANAVIG